MKKRGRNSFMGFVALVTATLLACGGDADVPAPSEPAQELRVSEVPKPGEGSLPGVVDASRYPTLQAAIDAAEATGTSEVRIPEGVFTYTAAPIIRSRLKLSGAGQETVLKLVAPTGHPENQGLRIESTLGPRWSVGSAALVAGQRTFTVDAPPVGLGPGDTVLMLLGTDPYDPNEEITRMFNVVESVVGNVVTLRTGLPEDIPAGARAHQLLKPTTIAEDVTIENLAFDYGPGVVQDQTIVVQNARNVTIRNVFGVRTAGAIEVRECENVVVENVHFERGDRTLHDASGRIIAGWGSRNVTVRNISATDVDGSGIFFESHMRNVWVEDVRLGSGPGARVSSAAVSVVGGSRGVRFHNVRLDSAVARTGLYVDQEADVRFDGLAIDGRMKGTPLADVYGSLEYRGVVYPSERTATRVIPLTPGMSDARTPLFSGVVKRLRVRVSHPGVTAAFVLNGAGAGADVARWLSVGETVEIASGPLVGIGDDYPFNEGLEKWIAVYTDGTIPQGATLTVTIDYFARDATDGAAPDLLQ